ncbi:MAG: hypothetical protein QGD89_10260 [Actinomycetota bacterium]|nr:hypothetical protein [Actinomycetota bacterium]
MNVICSAVQIALPAVGEAAITGPLAGHVRSCLPCRGEVARYRRLCQQLAELRDMTLAAPGSLTADVMSSLGPVAVADDESKKENRVPVAAAAVVVATAAAGTVVLLKLYRQRAA